jgi:hypothetical protein
VRSQLSLFYCPSNRTSGKVDFGAYVQSKFGQATPSDEGATDYLFCAGASGILHPTPLMPENARGVFEVVQWLRERATPIAHITDGASNTFAMGEGAGGTPRYKARGASTIIDQGWGVATVIELNLTGPLGSVLGVTAQSGGMDEPMNAADVMPTVDRENVAADTISGFRSMHSGGSYFLICDGTVRFVNQGINAANYRALSTRSGGEVVAGDF